MIPHAYFRSRGSQPYFISATLFFVLYNICEGATCTEQYE